MKQLRLRSKNDCKYMHFDTVLTLENSLKKSIRHEPSYYPHPISEHNVFFEICPLLEVLLCMPIREVWFLLNQLEKKVFLYYKKGQNLKWKIMYTKRIQYNFVKLWYLYFKRLPITIPHRIWLIWRQHNDLFTFIRQAMPINKRILKGLRFSDMSA